MKIKAKSVKEKNNLEKGEHITIIGYSIFSRNHPLTTHSSRILCVKQDGTLIELHPSEVVVNTNAMNASSFD